MSAVDARSDRGREPGSRDSAPQRYGAIVIVGGGCYGSYYVRQLGRAARAGAVIWDRVLVVDRDASCRAATESASLVGELPTGLTAPEVVVAEWSAFFRDYLGGAASTPRAAEQDAIVPSPLMPHLMAQWLLERARARWPRRVVEMRPLEHEPKVPWQRASPGGTHYVSFAEWICPVNCIEPRTCPEIRAPRTWSLPPTIRAYVEEEQQAGARLVGPAIFHCTHRAYGVGMFDTSDVLVADDLVRDAGSTEAVDVLVATLSHCHGALDRLSLGPL
jgi:hypothetical protein